MGQCIIFQDFFQLLLLFLINKNSNILCPYHNFECFSFIIICMANDLLEFLHQRFIFLKFQDRNFVSNTNSGILENILALFLIFSMFRKLISSQHSNNCVHLIFLCNSFANKIACKRSSIDKSFYIALFNFWFCGKQLPELLFYL